MSTAIAEAPRSPEPRGRNQGPVFSDREWDRWRSNITRQRNSSGHAGAIGVRQTVRTSPPTIWEDLTAEKARDTFSTLDATRDSCTELQQATHDSGPAKAASGDDNVGTETFDDTVFKRMIERIRALETDEGDEGSAAPLTRNAVDPTLAPLPTRTPNAGHMAEMAAREMLPEYAEYRLRQAAVAGNAHP